MNLVNRGSVHACSWTPVAPQFRRRCDECFAMADVRSEASSARSRPRLLRCDLAGWLASYSWFSPSCWSIGSLRQPEEFDAVSNISPL